MQAVKLPASAGWHWFRQGLAIFLLRPAPIFAWAMTVMLALMLASMLPPIGPLAFIVMFPTVSFFGFMLCRIAIGSQTVTAQNWLHIVRRQGMLGQLVRMGVWYAACNLGTALAVLWPAVSSLPESVVEAMLAEQNMQPLLDALRAPIIVLVVVNVLLGACFWYAPALVGFCGLSARRAMFYSAVACWRNKGAFLVYGLAFAALFWAVDQMAQLLLALGVSPGVLMMVQLPVHVAVASVLYCSMLPCFAEVFDESPPPAAASATPPNPNP